MRLDVYLSQRFPFFTRSEWQRRIERGELRVDHAVMRASSRLREESRLYMYHPEKVEPSFEGRISIVYCVGGVALVNKPPGMPMHEGGAFRFNTFARHVAELMGPEWSAVHRLDKETSGLVLCASTEALRRSLALQLREGRIKKEYRAVVHGQPTQSEWFVDAAIGDLEESQIRIKNWVVAQGGQSALTEFSLLEIRKDRALIAAYPRTGRTNQIRIHAAYSGFPLVGDKLYHPDESVFIDYYENGPSERVHQAVGHWRCCLHAFALSFLHPALNEWVSVRLDPPADFLDVLNNQQEQDLMM
jgi:RluA family pseudouridine synthase